jgi:hypothetical protein
VCVCALACALILVLSRILADQRRGFFFGGGLSYLASRAFAVVTKEDDDGFCFGHDLALIVRPRHLTRKFFEKVTRVSVSLLLFFLGTRTIVCVEYGLSAFQDGGLIRSLQPGSH